jgi:REP element-mobilizing transposase RayT
MDELRGHRALRKGRVSAPGRIYHVTISTAGRRAWFANARLAMTACRTFEPCARSAGASLICWVLMPDHFHGLVRLGETQSLSRCIQRLKGQATAACRSMLGTPAEIWARGFHDHAMRRPEDILRTARYIIANPQRAGLVEHALEYPYWNAEWL